MCQQTSRKFEECDYCANREVPSVCNECDCGELFEDDEELEFDEQAA